MKPLPDRARALLDTTDGGYTEWSTVTSVALYAINAGYTESEFVRLVSESPFAYYLATTDGRDRSRRLEGRIRKAWEWAEEVWNPELGSVEDVRDKLEALSRRLAARKWSGATGSTDRAVALALVAWAHEVGVWTLDASSRQVSLRAGVARTTAERSLIRLQELGVLVRDAGRGRVNNHAQRWVIQLGWEEDRDITSPHDPSTGGIGSCGLTVSLSHPAFLRSALGQTAERVWLNLIDYPDSTAAEIAKRLGVTAKTARRTLDRLTDHKLALVSGTRATTRPANTYQVNPAGSLGAVADEYGTTNWWDRTAERYERERGAYAAFQRRRTTPIPD